MKLRKSSENDQQGTIKAQNTLFTGRDTPTWKILGYRPKNSVTVDESIREIEGSEDEEKSEDNKSDICQLLKPKDGVSAQRQVLRALTLEV